MAALNSLFVLTLPLTYPHFCFGRFFTGKKDKKGSLSERSEFRTFPFFAVKNRGFRNSVVAFFGLPFSAKQKR